MAQLDVPPGPFSSQRLGARTQRRGCRVVVGDNAAIVHKWQRHGKRAEQTASKFDERQHTGDAGAVPRRQVEAGVAEGVRKDVAPCPLVVGRRVRMAADVGIPRGTVVDDGDRHHWYGSATDAPCGTRSTSNDGRIERSEPQEKSCEQLPETSLGLIEVAVVPESD